MDQINNEIQVEYIPLEVTSNILIHIGAGIYNSVAGAIKELVSNSYDADATKVVISTDYPDFEQIRVVDNGTGMSVARFKKAMYTIGSSLKGTLETRTNTEKYARPIIGQLGIGLMGLSQVCSVAIIESQLRGGDTRFVAELNFSQFKEHPEEQARAAKLNVLQEMVERFGAVAEMKERLESNSLDEDHRAELRAKIEMMEEAQERAQEEQIEDLEGEHLGYCMIYPNMRAIPGQDGTIVTLRAIDRGVRELLKDTNRSIDGMPRHVKAREESWGEFREEVDEWDWHELCERLRHQTSGLTYQSLPQYHQFLWELALMTPVQYFPGAPVTIREDLLTRKKKQLKRFDFSLIVDNRELFKPILLPSGDLAREEDLEEKYDYNIEPLSFEGEVDNSLLKYHGYLFWQRKQVKPSTIRGIQIYIRNVGIGPYDNTLLNFANVNPTSRAGQISGEIYAEEGLERALNIDRNSFRETDAHYLKLKEHVWSILGSAARGDGLIGKSVDAYWLRQERKEDTIYEKHVDDLQELVRSTGKEGVQLRFLQEEHMEPYVVGEKRIVVYDNSPNWPTSRKERLYAQRILVPVRAAIDAGASPHQILELLENLLLKS